MNSIGRLGELYGLSPATMAGLANVSGTAPPEAAPAPAGPPPPDAAPEPGFFDVPGQLHRGVDAVKRAIGVGPIAETLSPNANKAIETAQQATAPAPTAQPGDPAAQGPADDKFPTVKALGEGAAMGTGAVPSPVQVLPAHWQPGSHAVSMARGMSPDELETTKYNQDVAQGHELLAADRHYQAAQLRGAAEGAYAAARGAAEQHYAELDAAREQRKKTYVADSLEKLQQLNTQAQKQVDPKAYWKEKGALGSVLTGLMIGLGQFASMWKGGQNAALQIVNDQIGQNIDAQKANISNAHAALANESNLYRMNLDAFGDEARATLATKMQYLNHVASMVDQIKAGANDADTIAAKHDMVAKIYEHSGALAKELAELSHTKITEQENEHFVPVQTVGGSQGMKGKEALYVPTLGGYARDAETARKLNEKGALRMQIAENMHQISNLLDNAKRTNNPMALTDIDERVQSLVNDALTKNTVLEGQGAMSESDKAVAAEAKSLRNVSVQNHGLPLPNMIIERRQERIKTAASNMLTQHRIEGEAYGIQKGAEQYVQTPSGPVPVQKLEGRNATLSKRTQGQDDLVRPPKGVSK